MMGEWRELPIAETLLMALPRTVRLWLMCGVIGFPLYPFVDHIFALVHVATRIVQRPRQRRPYGVEELVAVVAYSALVGLQPFELACVAAILHACETACLLCKFAERHPRRAQFKWAAFSLVARAARGVLLRSSPPLNVELLRNLHTPLAWMSYFNTVHLGVSMAIVGLYTHDWLMQCVCAYLIRGPTRAGHRRR